MEIIEIDLQGPFPIVGRDGTVMNVKLVDNKSGFVKMETIANKEAETVLEILKRFQLRMERKTGNKIKIVRTDGGTEFQGVFQEYVK